MHMKKFILFTCLAVSLALQTSAQQLSLYSQWYFMRMLYNPALTAYNGSTDVYGFFRDQWTNVPGHPVTTGALGQVSLWNDRIGTGFHVYSDNTDILHSVDAQVYYAQKIHLGKDHILSLGVSFGLMQTYVDFNNAIATDAGDPHLLTNGTSGLSYDLNVGIAYQWKKLTVNFSVPQVLNNSVRIGTSVDNATYGLRRNFTGGASYEISIANEKFNIEPSVQVKSDFVSPLQYQIDANIMANYKRIVYLGFGYHLNYGFSVMAAVKISEVVTIGYDYDPPLMKGVAFGETDGSHELLLGISFNKWMKKKPNKNEDFAKQSQLDSIADALKKNIDTVKQNLDTLKQTVDSLKLSVDSLNNQQLNQQQIANDQQQKMQVMQNKLDSFANLANEYRRTITERPVRDFPSSVDKNTKFSEGDVLRLNSVTFAKNSSYLTQNSLAELNRVAQFLINNPNSQVRINGHTDITASDDYNLWLSDRRAKRVYDYLVEKGVPASRMTYVGFGKRIPIADNDTEEGRAKNRRVEIQILK
jgi:type IX secretion system PorP/SprF family membrane protein